MTRTGQRACGAVRFATDADPLWAGHCHCDSCRRASSAPFTSFFGVPRDSVVWTGTTAERESSDGVTRGYCLSCGSQVFYQNAIWPTETHLYAALLDDPNQFQPQAHYHYAERLPWLHASDDLPKYPGSADTTDPLP